MKRDKIQDSMDEQKFLQNEEHYKYRYDLQTILASLRLYWSIRESLESKRGQLKDMTQERFEDQVNKAASYPTNAFKAEKYRLRAETIKKWMDSDRKLQEKYDLAIPPRNIPCKECGSDTKVTSKDLLDTLNDEAQVLFMFSCTKCKKNQAFYEDGTEWEYKKPLCPKCNTPLISKTENKKDILTTIDSCPNCNYSKTDIYDFKKSRKEQAEKEAWERKIFAEYKDDFCLNDENGPQALRDYEQLARATEWLKEKEKKDNDPLIQKARQLKTLKALQLKELVQTTIEKEEYIDLQFGKPDIGQFVTIDFTVNDSKENRAAHDSTNTLKKLIKAVLEDTNWRLMSDGVSSRLGILSGRLKAYEREEDLAKLVS
jgi:RNase P subunit RPR2